MKRPPVDGAHAFGVFLAVLSGAGILHAGMSTEWVLGLPGVVDARLGPRGLQPCPDGCPIYDFGWHTPFGAAANLTFVLSIVCVVALVVASAIALLRPGIHRAAPGIAAFASSLLFLGAATVFVATNPFMTTTGAGFVVALFAALGGMAAGVALARRPVRAPFRP